MLFRSTTVGGRLDDAALIGGLAVGTITFDVVFGTFNSFRSGTTGLVAQAFGRADEAEHTAVLLRAVALALLIGSVLIALMQAIITAAALICPEANVRWRWPPMSGSGCYLHRACS